MPVLVVVFLYFILSYKKACAGNTGVLVKELWAGIAERLNEPLLRGVL